MSAIIRQEYLGKIEKYLGKEMIIVLTGQRRVGKSYILEGWVEVMFFQNASMF